VLSCHACAAAAQTSIDAGTAYLLTSRTSGLLLDNAGSSTTAPVTQLPSSEGSTNQQWLLQDVGNSQYMLINRTSGMALDDGGTTADGSLVTQYDASSSNVNQRWSIIDLGNGFFQLINAASGKALDNSGATSAGGSVWQWDADASNSNQMWSFTPVQTGAHTPFVSYEAESAALGGSAAIVALQGAPATKDSSPELEASGRAYVKLMATGDEVSWINRTGNPVSAINLRYSIPDAPQGHGIDSTIDLYVDDVFRQIIKVTSKQTWVYATNDSYDGMSKDPTDGLPHVFWDEAHTLIMGAPVAPGSTISLRKDAANNASYYDIDVVDVENPAPPATQPAGSLSIASYGARPNDISFDSTSAIQNCINAAQAQGRSVWIPPGTYYLNTPAGLVATGITIEGAGMWYSTIYYNPPLPAPVTSNVFLPVSVTMRNFAIDGNAISAHSGDGNGGAINIKGDHWLVDSLWIQHEGAGVWADGTNGLVQNNRVNNTWADGINLNNGNGGQGNDTGNDLVARNNFVRGTGDDGIAINDGGGTSKGMNNITVLQNTVVAPWWANNIAVYGGTNDVVANNLVTDSVREHGIYAGLFHDYGPLGSATIEGNLVLRGGSNGYGLQFSALSLGGNFDVTALPANIRNIVARGNDVIYPVFDGVSLETQQDGVVQNNTVTAPGLSGFVVKANVKGNATLLYNTASDVPSGHAGFVNQGAADFSLSSHGNVGLDP
jgi:hypothetical protein